MKRVAVPWSLLALLLVALAVVSIQGLRMARDRQQRLEPSPVLAEISIDCAGAAADVSVTRTTEFCSVVLRRDCQDIERIAIVEQLPERSVLRWAQPKATREDLVVPLEGLRDGIYSIVTLPPGPIEAAQEMDRPHEEWPLKARLVLHSTPP